MARLYTTRFECEYDIAGLTFEFDLGYFVYRGEGAWGDTPPSPDEIEVRTVACATIRLEGQPVAADFERLRQAVGWFDLLYDLDDQFRQDVADHCLKDAGLPASY